eukprot:UN07618
MLNKPVSSVAMVSSSFQQL